MTILSRYVLRQHVPPALAGLAIFYFVLSMDFIVDYLDLFIAKGVPGLAVLEAFGLSLAWMTLLAVPMAVMVSVLTAFGRLSGDNEITAAKANGVGVFSLIVPVLVAASLVAFGLFYFGNHVLPAANHRLKALLVDIHRIRPLAAIEPGILTDLPGGYSIIVDGADAVTSEILGVKIHKVEAGRTPQTIVASRGHISDTRASDVLSIELFDGEIHEIDPDDPTRYNRLLFERHVINIESGAADLVRSARAKRGDRELSLAELRARLDATAAEKAAGVERIRDLLGGQLAETLDAADGVVELPSPAAIDEDRRAALRKATAELRTIEGSEKQARRLEVEYHKKMSIPFACIVFVLLGAPIGIRSRRGGVGIGAGIGILFFLVYYLFLVGGEQLGDRGMVSPFWAMWAPNAVFGVLGIVLTASTSLEWRMHRRAGLVARPRVP